MKCFFFLALMRPADPAARPGKHLKWQYRRALFTEGLAPYESTRTIDTAAFPTLADFTARLTQAPPAVRDRDYLLDRHGVVFKVIGDVHPDSHDLGYVKYHPDPKGDRRLFGDRCRQNTIVAKSFGILADRPERYLYSPVLGCVITGLPRQDITRHYSARQALRLLHHDRRLAGPTRSAATFSRSSTASQRPGTRNCSVSPARSSSAAATPAPTSTSSATEPPDTTPPAACSRNKRLIRPYAGDDLMRLYLRRAEYPEGSAFDALIRQERRAQPRSSRPGGLDVQVRSQSPRRGPWTSGGF
ncbi:hypothetical protein LO772_35650 [Yinghuangia sp. ASG 101]|uniref:hypothetical protein n=1 Tax=Yinghuangia sp. ASG 101 TaxID=2896848 RepID=UPI001E2E5A28|nr:hypothetical protein [Yinghuangia sp. ASG 101]UGQ12027.1 hypothetical protein LO772_35650 [Yinghuangia sp. ASG 101]